MPRTPLAKRDFNGMFIFPQYYPLPMFEHGFTPLSTSTVLDLNPDHNSVHCSAVLADQGS